jgi:hypothetical protein
MGPTAVLPAGRAAADGQAAAPEPPGAGGAQDAGAAADPAPGDAEPADGAKVLSFGRPRDRRDAE